ncbi:MAG: T9SS type A sorting domain-containing protein, partial [Bacteroidia bacterium]|nr:T9SS type A sorting domain-containing protein [Bacteroidia bacterium]
VSHYLNLDGNIDLEGESQLIQTLNSDLEVTSSGTLERDQQGTADTYTYNYWASPVGISNITSNNNSYTLPDIMRDGTLNINFITSGYDGTATSPIGIADYWIWKFANQLDDDYASWQHVRSTGTLLAGEGFTMKGPGTGPISSDQNYVYNGKPNNGSINLTLSAGNDYLVGNPYASAIDAHQFILDNGPLISGTGATTGTLHFWEHWGGGNHNLGDYLGGYATYNLSGGTPSASMGTNDPDVGTGGTPTKTPGRYIPVGQGFFVVAETSGTINFNNGQRVFQRESASSVFMEANNPDTGLIPGRSIEPGEPTEPSADPRLQIRIGYYSVNTIRRQLLLTIDENATENIDWGYDGQLYETQLDDMYWMIEGDKYIIQGTDVLQDQTVFPLGIKTDNDGMNVISLDQMSNTAPDLEIYVHDKELDLYHDLLAGDYEFFKIAGETEDRFEITFSPGALGIDDNEFDTLDVHYSNDLESIVLVNPLRKNIKSIEMFNILGQTIYSVEAASNSDYAEYEVSNLSTGTYVLQLNTENGILSKKVLVE